MYAQTLDRLIRDAEQRRDRRVRVLASQALVKVGLTRCWFEDENGDCNDVATVHDVHGVEDAEYCLRHFEVTR